MVIYLLKLVTVIQVLAVVFTFVLVGQQQVHNVVVMWSLLEVKVKVHMLVMVVMVEMLQLLVVKPKVPIGQMPLVVLN